jgi:phosphoribosylanthranilate isomerase
MSTVTTTPNTTQPQNHPAIKICGLKTPEMATFCAQMGAQFVGVVFSPPSPRHVDVPTASLIAAAAHQAGIIPVAVFSLASDDDIIDICQKTNISCVQLHGDVPRLALQTLPDFLQKIYVIPQNNHGITKVNPQHLDFLRPEKDFILFDGEKGGSGQTIRWDSLKPPKNLRFFLAGGLNVENIMEAIQATHPFAVDVSSGVEYVVGEKSKELIQQFIAKVKMSCH